MRNGTCIIFSLILGICCILHKSVNAQDIVELAPRKGQYVFNGLSPTDIRYNSEFRLTPVGGTTVLQITPSKNVLFFGVPKLAVDGIIASSGMFKACANSSFTLTSSGAFSVASVSTTGRDTAQKIYVHGAAGGLYAFATADTSRSLRVYLYSASAGSDLDFRDYDSQQYDSGGSSNVGMFDSNVLAHATGFTSDTYTVGLFLFGSTYNGLNFVQGRAKICAHELP